MVWDALHIGQLINLVLSLLTLLGVIKVNNGSGGGNASP